jgi:hypothetical protein
VIGGYDRAIPHEALDPSAGAERTGIVCLRSSLLGSHRERNEFLKEGLQVASLCERGTHLPMLDKTLREVAAQRPAMLRRTVKLSMMNSVTHLAVLERNGEWPCPEKSNLIGHRKGTWLGRLGANRRVGPRIRPGVGEVIRRIRRSKSLIVRREVVDGGMA